MLFFIFIPGTLAVALVFSPNLQAGLFYATAQSLNWLLGAASYFLLPSLGPIYAEPAAFAQPAVLRRRPSSRRCCSTSGSSSCATRSAGTAQSIAAFASLHVSIFFTGALAAHLLGLGAAAADRGVGAARADRRSRRSTSAGTTCSTTSRGVVIGAMAVVLARALTGFDLRRARRTAAARPAPA